MKPIGSVTEHVDRFGKLSYRARLTEGGKRKSLGLHPTREDAECAIAAALEQLGGSERGITLTSWGATWLERRAIDGLHRSASKDASRWKTLVAPAPFALWPLRKITRQDVVRWVGALLRKPVTHAINKGRGSKRETELVELDRRLSRQSVVIALALLRRALSDAADEGHVPTCVARDVKVPRVPRTTEAWTYLSATEIDAVLKLRLKKAQRAIFTTAIYAGLRGGELWGLRWLDVLLDGERPELVVRHSYRGPTKSGRVRRVPLLTPAREALRAWRLVAPGVGQALVFPADGGGCHSEGYDAGWGRVRERAGIERRVRLHDLRHTCASHLVMGTWTPKPWRLEDARDWLGHGAISTTERYAHLAPDRLHGLAAEAREDDGKGRNDAGQ